MSFFAELKRRNVIRVAAAYLLITWLLVQVLSLASDAFEAPAWVMKMIITLIAIGFLPVLLFSWAFEITPEGIKKEEDVQRDESITNVTAKKLDLLTLAAAVGIAFLIGWQQFRPTQQSAVDQQITLEKSIAVLPFVNMSGDKENEYFSDGITEEILNALAKINQLKVASRTTSFTYKGKNEDLRSVGASLGVDHILEGSVRKQGDQVRITAQLIQTDDDVHLWSETYNGTLDNIFELQEEIARAIASELQLVLDVGASPRLAKRLTQNNEAYDLFLQGRELARQVWGEDTLPNAISLLEQAIELDPEFAEAWNWLAIANLLLPQHVQVSDQLPYILASERAALKGIQLDPELAEGYSLLGSNRFLQRDMAYGLELVEKAYKLAPNDPLNIFNQGFYRAVLGQTEEAIPWISRALESDPTNGSWIHNLAYAQIAAGNLQEAEKQARRSVEIGYKVATFTVAECIMLQGDSQGAIDYMNSVHDQVKAYSVHFQNRQVWDVALQAMFTQDPQARQSVSDYLTNFLDSTEGVANIASVGGFHLIGEPEKFMQAYEANKFAGGSFVLTRIWTDREDTIKLRQHPDFQGFAKRVGLVDAWQKYGWPDKCRPVSEATETSDLFVCD